MNKIAVVLAAGAGRKFWPYNEVRNKCAFPIANVPVVMRIVGQLREIGFERIAVVVGYQEGSIRAALRSVEEGIVYVRQPAGAAGTTAGVLAALGTTEEVDAALVIYGDSVVATEDIRATWKLVAESEADASMLAAPLAGERTQDWIVASPGVARAAGGTRLGMVDGHSRDGSHRAAGVYALGRAAAAYLRAQPEHMTHISVGAMPPAEADVADAVATMADDGRDAAFVETTRPSVDMDKPWHIIEATHVVLREMAEGLTESRIADGATVSDGAEIKGPILVEAGATIGNRVVISGPAWIGRNSRVVNGAIVGTGVVIGSGCRVSDYCLVNGGSVVGNECIVGHGGEFDGVMLDRSYIYHYSEIYGVLGLAVDIGAATVCGTLRFDDAETIHKIAGRREHPRDGANATYFGDYSRTGVNVITQPGSKIGAYSCVGAGVVLYEDVPSRKLILLKQETVQREWGPERYGW